MYHVALFYTYIYSSERAASVSHGFAFALRWRVVASAVDLRSTNGTRLYGRWV
jgi:hypothetical protein